MKMLIIKSCKECPNFASCSIYHDWSIGKGPSGQPTTTILPGCPLKDVDSVTSDTSTGIPISEFWEKDDGVRMDGLIRIERFIKSQGTKSAQIWSAWHKIKSLVKASLSYCEPEIVAKLGPVEVPPTPVSEESGELKRFEVWVEGYRATGDESKAELLGTVAATSFDEACILVVGDKLSKDDKGVDGYARPLNIWGCRLFDNASDARKAFG